MSKQKAILKCVAAALLVLSAALYACAQNQNRAVKQNTREEPSKVAAPLVKPAPAEGLSYSYEFTQPNFFVRHIVINHDASGRGQISFERQGDLEPLVEPLTLSPSALSRITALWDTLRFLDSTENYQSERQYPHLGTMRLTLKLGTRERLAEFNWTNNTTAKALVDEYRRVSNQAIFIFDITLARENQPLNAPKLMDLLERFVASNELSDLRQLIPLLQELKTDERLPLMARNQAGRILKKIESKTQIDKAH